jgi:hypothetical protein
MAQPQNLYQLIKPIEIEITRVKKNMSLKAKWKECYKPMHIYEQQIKELEKQIETIINNYNLTK